MSSLTGSVPHIYPCIVFPVDNNMKKEAYSSVAEVNGVDDGVDDVDPEMGELCCFSPGQIGRR